MKTKKRRGLVTFIMVSIFFMSLFSFGAEVNATQTKTVVAQGSFPCSEGSVEWIHYNDGELVFSGQGTLDMINQSGGWKSYWNKHIDKSSVKSVRVEVGSKIYLDACNSMFSQFENCIAIDLTGCDYSNVTNMCGMFAWCESLTNLDVSDFDTTNVTDMGAMFSCCESLTYLDVSKFDTTNVTSMREMFEYCSKLQKLDVSKFNTSNVTRMDGMFKLCSSLTELDVSNFDTKNVTDMKYMFHACKLVKNLDVSKFNTSNVTCMNYMFGSCCSVQSLDISHFDTSKVTNMDSMFYCCELLPQLDVSRFDTSAVTSMAGMFGRCSGLTELDVSIFDTSKVTTMDSMFSFCEKLTNLDVSNFDTTKVTDLDSMFYGCCKLKNLDVSHFNTANVTSMGLLFTDCRLLQTLDVSSFDTSKVTTMISMFAGCQGLQELDVSNFNTSKVTDMWNMFHNCISLKSLSLANFDTSSVERFGEFADNCESMPVVDLSNLDTTSMEGAFVIRYNNEVITPNMDTRFAFKEGAYLYDVNKDRYYTKNVKSIWYDENGNIYHGGEEKLIPAKTRLYRVNKYSDINYIYKSETYPLQEYEVEFGLDTLPVLSEEQLTEMGLSDCIFVGWYEDAEYTVPVTSIAPMTIGDITLYPKIVNKKYAITYKNTEQVKNVKDLPIEYAYGKGFALPAAERDCYAFLGWYLDENFTKKITDITDTMEDDLVLYAKWEISHDVDKTKGTVIVEPTTTTEGTMEYPCKNCDYKETETIPKLGADFIAEEGIPEETVVVTDETILSMKDDGDVKGSSFVMIQARADKNTKNSVRLKWSKVKNADGYKIYGNKCGKKNRMKLIKTIENGKTTTFTQKKLKKGTYYKYIVRAYKLIDGKQVTIAVSKTIHSTTKGGKYGVAKAVKIKTDKKMKSKKGSYTLTIKKNKKYTIKASEVKESKKIQKHRKIAYESSDKSIATVSKKGVVKGLKKGTCYIYAYAQNGVYKKIKVKVQ